MTAKARRPKPAPVSWTVDVYRTIRESSTVEVEAVDADEAQDLARGKIDDCEDWTFEHTIDDEVGMARRS